MTFKKFKFSNKDIQLREAELELLVTLLSNLSLCKTKSGNKIPDTTEVQLNMFVMKVWPGSRNILLTRLGRE